MIRIHYILGVFFTIVFSAQSLMSYPIKPIGILAAPEILDRAGIKPLVEDNTVGVAYSIVSPLELDMISRVAHGNGSCAGFERLEVPATLTKESVREMLSPFYAQLLQNQAFELKGLGTSLTKKPEVENAINKVDVQLLRDTVTWLSSFTTRYYSGTAPNLHVEQLEIKLKDMVKKSGRIASVDLVEHRAIHQKSIRVRLDGYKKPDEVIILGAHLDSINRMGVFGGTAPGADDNASGSANIIEALRILLEEPPLERTIEFFWYAGEEGGLLGSREIATTYQLEKVNVIGVLQLDMTLFPGDGQFVLGSMTDFTSSWMRSYLEQINSNYIHAQIIEDKCGYGCSDHASWYKSGYPTLMPFEATFDGMNHNIHTSKDVISTTSDFKHSAMFTKIAIALAMELGNSHDHANLY